MGLKAVGIILVVLLQFLGYVNGENHIHRQNNDIEGCDLYNGRWVYDHSFPLYNSSQCSFIDFPFDCQKNGRPDQLYLKFSWKPNSCHLPKFDAAHFLEKFENKRITIVGDSLSLNQWQSLTCMLHSVTPHSAYISHNEKHLTTFTFLNHNVSVMFSWNPLLVEISHRPYGRLLVLNSIADVDAKIWLQSDVLVFNSWHHWIHVGRKKPWDFIMDGDHLRKDMNRLVAYAKALRTWAQWVEKHIDHTKTRVFFMGISPTHMDGRSWGNYDRKNCSEEREPFFGTADTKGKAPEEMIAERVIGRVSKHVHLLNINQLSQLRKDAHPSVYGLGGHRGMDCSHWCLPGLPDTWNQLLYAELTRN